ncbi:hypothetical protein A33M_3417 [Rhodovulum sp. PH10]|nr:hypothetical protein A33M_3417 [Rhodovulum sp. PH10]
MLPAIRKTGGDVLAVADPANVEVGATEMMPLPATFTEALRQHAATLIELAEETEAHARTTAERRAVDDRDGGPGRFRPLVSSPMSRDSPVRPSTGSCRIGEIGSGAAPSEFPNALLAPCP